MRKRLSAALITLVAAAAMWAVVVPPASAGPAAEYSRPYFGREIVPAGCEGENLKTDGNVCHHMRVDMNGLDSPQIDVLVLVPVSPTAERDMRIMRQSIEMWAGGIDYLAEEMGLQWLADGVDFDITVDYVPVAGDGGEFSTYPLVDPEIVVIATNPVGGAGIGVDPPAYFLGMDLPCHGIVNPFDFEHWESVPGFDNHHGRSGTYTNEDCGGAGGNVCFAVNGAIDPMPDQMTEGGVLPFGLFDLVSHEVGHCLSIGHVGDGAEGKWGAVPTNDIMAYDGAPTGRTKCVSTLNVEGIAIRMSEYLDTNGDDVADDRDRLDWKLHEEREGKEMQLSPFHVQHPDDHLYASATGSPLDCPQPDLGLVRGERTSWTPTAVDTVEPVLTISSPEDGATSVDGSFTVEGTVERVVDQPQPPASSSYDDPDDDATTPLTEILAFDVAVDDSTVAAVLHLAEVWPTTSVHSPTSYSITMNGRRFDTWVDGIAAQPRTYDWKGGPKGTGGHLPLGTSTWDAEAGTITVAIPRTYLTDFAISTPYTVSGAANLGARTLPSLVVDDHAPDVGSGITVATPASSAATLPLSILGSAAAASTVQHEGVFQPYESFGMTGTSHTYDVQVSQPSAVDLTLAWNNDVGFSDLDLYVTGPGIDAGSTGATLRNPEQISLSKVNGPLEVRVQPYFVTDPRGLRYTLTITVKSNVDTDGDRVRDVDDVCPDVAGDGTDGCPIEPREHVRLYVDGVLVDSQVVDTGYGPDQFQFAVEVPEGEHELRLDWEDRGVVLTSATVSVVHEPGLDSDGDGVGDDADVCPKHADPEQEDLDGDGRGDACDADIDGDGHSNGKERAHGTDPREPSSYPQKGPKGTI